MRSGDLRKRITLEQRATTQDSFGAQAITWSTVATVWAAITPMAGRELMTAQAIAVEITHQIVMRYQTGITAAMRVNLGGRYFDIHAVLDETERHRMLTLLCSEGLNDG